LEIKNLDLFNKNIRIGILANINTARCSPAVLRFPGSYFIIPKMVVAGIVKMACTIHTPGRISILYTIFHSTLKVITTKTVKINRKDVLIHHSALVSISNTLEIFELSVNKIK